MKKTIYDIAREAGVGVSTVSRALNNSGYVSEETMRKIEKASIGYTKSKSRSSVNTHGKSIGLIVSHDPEYFFVNSTYLNAMIGISAVARENDIHLILEISNQTERCLSLYKSGMVDGVILMGIKQDNTLIDSLLEMHCPLVLIGDYLDDSKKFCKIDIDDLYYEGYDSANGKTLTFKRKDQDYQSWLNNILLYTSGSNQKLMGISFENPTPSYTLAFKLKTADIEIEKLDEYFKSQNFSEGTQFVIGWYDDPTYQYRYDGGKDENWQDLYNFNVGIDPDLYGSFNYVNGNKTYYPIMTLDGTNIRTFTIGADGLAHISDLLPRHKSWWIKEWKVTNPYLIDERPFLVKTNDQNETTHQYFVNMLRYIDLSIIKQDSDIIYL